MTAIYTFSTTGAGSTTVPAGATTMTAECWGGGGSGGGGVTALGCGGGGGGYSAFTVSVTPGATVFYNIGLGGTGGGTGVGVNGGVSWVNPSSNAQPSSNGCVGNGGNGALSSTGGTGGTGTIGTTNHTGGDGGLGSGNQGGGGGGGAGSTANGSTASGHTHGAGGTPDGGDGVDGGISSATIPGGVQPAGGGGGSWNSTSGDGAPGRVRLTFDVAQTLAVDGTATALFTGTNTGTITLTTSQANDVIVLMFYAENNVTAQPSVSTVTSSHLTWAKRSAYSVAPNSQTMTVEIWWATAASALSAEVITVTLSGTTDAAAFQAFGVTGCPTPTSPWDINASISSAHLNASVISGSIGSISISTTSNANMLVGMWGCGKQADSTPLPTGISPVQSATHNGAGNQFAYSQAFYQANTSKLTSASYAFTAGAFGNYAIALDAINGDAGSIPNKIIEITRGAAYRASYF